MRLSNYTLTPTWINNAKAKARLYKLSDGGGLFVEVSTTGQKTWRYRYRFAGSRREVKIGRYSEIGVADARVGKGQTFNQDLVPGDQPVRDRPIHEVRSAIDLLGREVRPVLDQDPLPLIVDLGAPAGAKAPGEGDPHEEVAQRRRVQHAGVIDRGERRTPHS